MQPRKQHDAMQTTPAAAATCWANLHTAHKFIWSCLVFSVIIIFFFKLHKAAQHFNNPKCQEERAFWENMALLNRTLLSWMCFF